MSESILNSTKAALGMSPEYTPFDLELIMFINSTLGTVNQLGIGPPLGFTISDETATWDDLTGGELRYEAVKSYVFLCVRLLHDPPTVGYVLSAWQKLKEETEWRLNRAREDIVNPASTPAAASTKLAKTIQFDVKSGLPFARRLVVKDGKNLWATLDAFEARMQIRETEDATSQLVYNFTPHLIKSFAGNDIVVQWELSGEQTRELKAGHFDLVISDIGATDEKGIQVIRGYLNLMTVITSAEG